MDANVRLRMVEEEDGRERKRAKVSEEEDVEGEKNTYELANDESESVPTQEALYLETIDRKRLDFDFEKLCSVSLNNNNVYGCLTCGSYFQGRGKSSYAYLHSVDCDHHVFINLHTLRIYVLPEGYEVKSAVLDDIKYVVDPYYSKEYVESLDTTPREAYDLSRRLYWPGYIGINNLKANDYSNVIIQLLVHIPPLRDHLMLNKDKYSDEMVKRFSTLIRKIWNPKAFKPHVSPHELLQHVAVISKKKFRPIEQADPFAFMNWFLNQLHLGLGGSKTKPKSSLVQQVFQGKMRIESQKITASAAPGDRLRFEADTQVQVTDTRFLFLTLDLPPTPLFKDDIEGNVIPQISLTELLKKYDGTTTQELAGERKRFKILQLPQYLILVVKRFAKIGVIEDRNPTVVRFDPRALNMTPFLEDAGSDIIYSLVGNVVYELNKTNQGDKHSWKAQILDRSRQSWLQIQDLIVEQVRAELLFLSESYIQVWQRN